jgi:tetratricopeptide (TPR) repeat protein
MTGMKFLSGILLKCFCLTAFVSTIAVSSIFAQEKAQYKEKFLDGTYSLLEENYTGALNSFLEAYQIDSTNANINFNVGFSYLNSISEKTKAIGYLEKAIENVSDKYTPFEPKEKRAPTNALYYLGLAYRYAYRFDDAVANFERFKSYVKAKEVELVKEVDRQIEMCKNAKEIYASPTDIKISMVPDSVNSPYPDYSPVISADESTLIFTSRRPGGTGYDLTPTGEFYEDIYISYKDDKKHWGKPVSIGPNINTSGHEAAIGLSANGEQLLIYKDDNGDGNIYIIKLVGETWSEP